VGDMRDEYGRCPFCGGKCDTRERRLNGNDTCENGHVYPSRAALTGPDDRITVTPDLIRVTIEDDRWETVCRPAFLPLYHRQTLKDCKRLDSLLIVVTALAARHEQTIDTLRAAVVRLRAACGLIVGGWGHQDGVAKAVEAARDALAATVN
jgi:hypothetical protein